MTTKIETNPTVYGLAARIQLEQVGDDHIAIRKVVKSRIVMKDAIKIIEIAEQIKSVHPHLECTLICTQNICSKSVEALQEKGITLEYV